MQAPLFKYSFSSVSNILSSVSQYEALKYVSFPTQVLLYAPSFLPPLPLGSQVAFPIFSSLPCSLVFVVHQLVSSP